MSTFQELSARAEAVLTSPPNEAPVAPAAALGVEALGPAAGGQDFTAFLPSHQKRALELTSRFMELANAQPGPEGLARVLEEAERAAASENSDLVKYALMVFITHHPEGRRLPIPPLEERSPEAVLPSHRDAGPVEALGALGDEAKLDYFREDIAVNDHHNKWHVVYPGNGHPDPQDPWGANITKDRQGELFWYMHQQMLARYDTERAAFDLPPVEPLADYRLPIPEGYEANLPGFSHRLPDAVIEGFPGEYEVADHEERRDRLLQAAESGVLRKDGLEVPITAPLLGDTIEATVGSVEGADWEDSLSFYGQHHNFGHVLIAALPDPNGPFPTRGGVMRSTATAVRDPVFFRWHRHVDDVFVHWQETLEPNDFQADAPPVRIRQRLDAAGPEEPADPENPGDPETPQNAEEPEGSSPDILLALAADIPGSGEPGFDGQAFGEAAFGGDNWDQPRSALPGLIDELRTRMRRQTVRMPDGSAVQVPYLDHEEFFYFLRLENPADEPQQVTVRLFLTARQFAEDRRRWIEMDKFSRSLEPRQRTVVFRPARQSSVVRKPARRPSEPRPPRPPGAADQNYCDCGWPYHLLLPRGTEQGMDFRLLVMLTSGQADLVGAEKKCGSMSFCGARDARYPDSRRMGYPFDRPFGGRTIAETAAAQPNMAARDLRIRHVVE